LKRKGHKIFGGKKADINAQKKGIHATIHQMEKSVSWCLAQALNPQAKKFDQSFRGGGRGFHQGTEEVWKKKTKNEWPHGARDHILWTKQVILAQKGGQKQTEGRSRWVP